MQGILGFDDITIFQQMHVRVIFGITPKFKFAEFNDLNLKWVGLARSCKQRFNLTDNRISKYKFQRVPNLYSNLSKKT